ncbi:MAG TPA: efflux RND transporter permease subunit [Intrasporangium sp.]|uniref:efflux RND transporter permease subunit n=1 Tax=Intrasporangium sp. TaxID=1925024 RepID=UPI002D77445F|nr:efflux RND transporter permease subunit [Intrasporangium sp.]HET7397291.1 efflux RND transporter permease subunit [Intrasporangium sp.]
MMRWIIGSSIKFRRLVIVLAAGVVILGVSQLGSARTDLLPEFSRPTVEVQTEALGLSAEEVEQFITVPLEQDLLIGIAFLDKIESVSMPGLSSVVMTFEPGTDVLDARQVVAERLTQAVGVAGLPQVAKLPQMIQPLSSTARVGMVKLSSDSLSPIEMSVLARWQIVPRLMGVDGVANVAIWGFRDRQLQVLVDPAHLHAKGVALKDVIRTTGNALEVSNLGFLEASSPGTGGFIDTPNQRYHVFHEQAIKTPEALAKVPIEAEGAPAPQPGGRPLTLGDVSQVVEGHQPLIGDALCSDGDCILLVVEKFPGVNMPAVAKGIESALATMAPGLTGIKIDTSIHRPAAFVESSMANLGRALAVGGLLALLVIALFLWSWRTALVATVAVLVSAATAWLVLSRTGTTVNGMVLAGLVLGLLAIVDDAIISVDHIARRLREHHATGHGVPVWRALTDAALDMRAPVLYATLIVAAATIPAFFLPAEAGAFLPSVALAYLLAVVASIVVALIVVSALSMLLLAGAGSDRNDGPLVRWVRRAYSGASETLVGRRVAAVLAVGILAVVGLVAIPFLDQNHRPQLLERDLQVELTAPPGTSLTRMDEVTAQAVTALGAVAGVDQVGAHVGRAVTSDQVVNVNSAEVWVNLDEAADYDATVAAIKAVAGSLPAVKTNVRTYSAQRVTEILGESGDGLAVRVYGEDPEVLQAKAEEIRGAISGIGGVQGARVETTADEPTIEVTADVARAQKVGIKPGDVRRTSATLLSGLMVGNLFDAQKVFDVVVWGAPGIRQTPGDVSRILIDAPNGGDQVRLGDVATVQTVPRPTVIRHQGASTYLDVVAGVTGRPLADVTGDVEAAIARVSFPFEHHAEVLANVADAQAERLRVIVIAVAVAVGIFLLLQAAFVSWRLAAVGFLLLALALAGGAAAILLSGAVVSLGSLAGLVGVLLLAARGLVLLVRRYQQLERDGEPFGAALVTRGTSERIAPVLATLVAAAALFTPLALSGRSAGLEVVGPMAVAVLGGLVSTAVVLLVVLPAAYLRFGYVADRDTSADEFDELALLDFEVESARREQRP